MLRKPNQVPTQRILKWMGLASRVFLISLYVLMPGVGLAYEALPDFSGKQLTGTVKLKGKIPSPKRFNLVLFSDPYYCGRISDGKGWRISPRPVLGQHAELSGAVVFLEEVKKGKLGTTPKDRTIQTKNCVFLPYVNVAQVGQTFHFQNLDPIQHKLEVFLTSQQGAQSLMMKSLEPHPANRKSDFLSTDKSGVHQAGPEIVYRTKKWGILVFRCRLHDYMESWSLVLPHPYFAITGDNGEFLLEDIPPGEYNLVVWHPLGQQKTIVQIGGRQTSSMNVFITPSSATVYEEEDEPAKNPFGIDLVGDSSIVPTVERQRWKSTSDNDLGAGS